MRGRVSIAFIAGVVAIFGILCGNSALAKPRVPITHVTIETSAPIATFRASEALGLAADGGAAEDARPLFLAANRPLLRKLAGSRFSYRLRTELGIEAWHWSSQGQWSDAARQQGYWTGEPPARPGTVSYGYRLPRRGDTNDEANNDGYSRIDDGDAKTFWKSNPYLDGSYTGLSGDHQDWIVVDLHRAAPVDGIRLDWAAPYARRFKVQYWIGEDEYDGHWHDFALGIEAAGHGGTQLIHLSGKPVRTRFVRILLKQSSHSVPAGSTDPRDRLGYAVAELAIGAFDRAGRLHDLIRHAPDHARQTVMYVSSTDPWHRASDVDRGTVQPSLVEMKRRGLLGSAPVMIPVGVLYDTPDNMLALLRYLKREGLPLKRVELGEEPDGQLISAEDYAALYVEYAKQIRRSFPDLATGGPSLVNGVSDTWLVDSADQSWTSHFVKYLAARRASDLLNFFTFEYFPFDDVCGAASLKLRQQSVQMRELFERLGSDGVPRTIPWLITEYGYSAYGGKALVQIPSALLEADVVGDFLGRGGAGTFLYGSGPNWPIAGQKKCAGNGNLMLWEADRSGRARWPMPQYFAYRMITDLWAERGDRLNRLFRARADLKDRRGRPLVTAYPLQRPDGRWRTMLVNRSAHAVAASLHFAGPNVCSSKRLVWQYSERQYCWRTVTAMGRPSRDQAPVKFVLRGRRAVVLPALSLTLVAERGRTPDRRSGPTVIASAGGAAQVQSAP